ncbi:D-beta-hydroxybutyrate dehydrogenase, mitochondrial-like [Haliotis asinina]|uniref:D-beta-hydroxybutyrate dehydrogenase, mitochondrial-like n=1 Tax=Haliotis asinina TaxID=109174 RepID=UPI003531D4B1
MTLRVDMSGLSATELLFCVSALFLIYMSPHGLTVVRCLLTGSMFVSYWLIRHARARRIDPRGKYILITGCDTGFGNSLARLLDSKGLKVFATCLSEHSEGAKLLTKDGSKNMRVLQLDVSSDASVDACLEQIKSICFKEGLWALVNNAGIIRRGDVEIQTVEAYKRIAEVNLFGAVRMCKAFLPLVRKCKGRVINVTSVRGLQAFCGDSAYVMSKFGLEGFTDCLRLEMRRFGVKVIHVEPGMFGLSTGLYNEENVERYKVLNKKLIDNVSDEIRTAYGQDYLDTYMRVPKMRPGSSDKDIQPMLDAFEDAILSSRPNSRYLVDGKSVDGDCTMARLRNVLPVFIMDPLYFYLRPLPKEAFYASTTSRH